MGGVSGVASDPKLVLQVALKLNATGVIIAHNHPSGNSTPSQQDIDLTKKLKNGCSLLDISFLDHLIMLPGESYYSFADEGLV
jgi:DNA repair protein RadC